ncbi:F-box domain containing protein [Tanacetum coccineum]
MSDMTTLLNDLSYIPPNNEHNEPTQGDIGYNTIKDQLPPSYDANKEDIKNIGLGYESIHAYEHIAAYFGETITKIWISAVVISRWKTLTRQRKKVPKEGVLPTFRSFLDYKHATVYPVDGGAGKKMLTQYPDLQSTRIVQLGLSCGDVSIRMATLVPRPTTCGRSEGGPIRPNDGILLKNMKRRKESISDVEDPHFIVDDDVLRKVYSSKEKMILSLAAGTVDSRERGIPGDMSINFELGDKQTLNPLGPHAAHWSNYIGEVVRSVPLYYPSWEKVPKERKAAIISEIGTLFDLRPHMDSSRWTEIYEGINMHLQKAYNTNKASFKAKHWKADPTTGTYDVEAIRRARPEEITAAEWDKYIKFWNDPKNLARAAQNRLNRQKSVVTSRQGSRSLARLRDEMRQASDTQEYPSLIDTFWRTHTVDGVFPKDEDRRIYEEMKRLEATGEYTEDEINALARGGKLRGHIPGVGRVLPSRATSRPSMSAPVDKSLKSMHRKVDFMMSLFRSDNKYADMFKEFESGGASGSGGCGDDEESGDDEDDDGER